MCCLTSLCPKVSATNRMGAEAFPPRGAGAERARTRAGDTN